MYSVLRILVVFCAVFGGAEACQSQSASIGVSFKLNSGAESPQIQAELALSPAEQQRGLMYRREMPHDRGMLFVFPAEAERSFWMKNTYLELDMVFVNADMRIVSIIHRAVPLTESPRPSKRPAKYVLELNGGQAAEWKISEGDLMVVHGSIPPSN